MFFAKYLLIFILSIGFIKSNCCGSTFDGDPFTVERRKEPITYYSIATTAHSELRRLDPYSEIKESSPGSMSAWKIFITAGYIARVSIAQTNRQEVRHLEDVMEQISSRRIRFSGFEVCLPLSIKLIESPDRVTSAQSASIFVMRKAQGDPLLNYLTSRHPKDFLIRMVSALGSTLGKFQTPFMEEISGKYYTAAHGDFHESNIFGFPTRREGQGTINWAFSLIDCGGLKLRNDDPLMDPLYFIYRANYLMYTQGYDRDSLLELTQSFYQSYFASLPSPIVRTFGLMTRSNLRNHAAVELARTRSLLFLNPARPHMDSFVRRFDKINFKAFRSALSSLRSPMIRIGDISLF